MIRNNENEQKKAVVYNNEKCNKFSGVHPSVRLRKNKNKNWFTASGPIRLLQYTGSCSHFHIRLHSRPDTPGTPTNHCAYYKHTHDGGPQEVQRWRKAPLEVHLDRSQRGDYRIPSRSCLPRYRVQSRTSIVTERQVMARYHTVDSHKSVWQGQFHQPLRPIH